MKVKQWQDEDVIFSLAFVNVMDCTITIIVLLFHLLHLLVLIFDKLKTGPPNVVSFEPLLNGQLSRPRYYLLNRGSTVASWACLLLFQYAAGMLHSRSASLNKLTRKSSQLEAKWQSGRHYLRRQGHEENRSISTPPWMGCQSIAGLPPALNSPVPIYTPGWREAPWE